jgi:hypothetical protein
LKKKKRNWWDNEKYEEFRTNIESVFIFLFISVISWRSVLLVEETGIPGENYRPVASH